MSAKQAPPLVAGQLQKLVGDIRRRVPTVPTAAQRFVMVRDVMIFCVAFNTMKRGFELSVALASQVLQMSRGEGFIFNFLFSKLLRESSQTVVVRRNVECREICAVAAMVECRQAATSMQWALAEDSGFCFPSVLESGDKGKLALAPAQLTSNRQAHLRAEHKRYSRHSFRVGAAASHHMDGTAMDVLLEYVGWRSVAVASRYVGMTASASAPNGTERSRDTAFIQADA